MKNIFAVIGMFAVLLCLIVVFSDVPNTRVYDCGMAEWHPDIPNSVKEECRRIRYEQWKKENESKYRT